MTRPLPYMSISSLFLVLAWAAGTGMTENMDGGMMQYNRMNPGIYHNQVSFTCTNAAGDILPVEYRWIEQRGCYECICNCRSDGTFLCGCTKTEKCLQEQVVGVRKTCTDKQGNIRQMDEKWTEILPWSSWTCHCRCDSDGEPICMCPRK